PPIVVPHIVEPEPAPAQAAREPRRGSVWGSLPPVADDLDPPASTPSVRPEVAAAALRTAPAAPPVARPLRTDTLIERHIPRRMFTFWGEEETQDKGEGFHLPTLDLLTTPPRREDNEDEQQLQEKSMELESVLQDFGVRGQIVNARPGPVVTL